MKPGAVHTLYRNTTAAALWDISYILNTATRIEFGEIPYRDFPLAHAPFTFVVQAIVMKVFQHAYLAHILYAAVVSALGTAMGIFILNRFSLGKTERFLAAGGLVLLSTNAVYPHPFYDPDATVLVLIALVLLLKSEAKQETWPAMIAGGIFGSLILVKQKVALAAPALLVVLLVLAMRSRAMRCVARGYTLGLGIAWVAVSGLIAFVFGFDSFVRWAIRFPAETRLSGWQLFQGYLAFRSRGAALCLLMGVVGCFLLRARSGRLGWLGAIFIILPAIALCFWGTPLLWVYVLPIGLVLTLLRLREVRSLIAAMPLVVAVISHAYYLSAGLGSTYSIWPLLIIDVIAIGQLLREQLSGIPLARVITVSLLATILVGGIPYVFSHPRHIDRDGGIRTSSYATLQGLRSPGPYLAELDGLLEELSARLEPQDTLLALPGEDPIYFALREKPAFPVVTFDSGVGRTTNPYGMNELLRRVRASDIDWIVIKNRLQIVVSPMPGLSFIGEGIGDCYSVAWTGGPYEILHRERDCAI